MQVADFGARELTHQVRFRGTIAAEGTVPSVCDVCSTSEQSQEHQFRYGALTLHAGKTHETNPIYEWAHFLGKLQT